jgi:hypothetical protein
MSTVVGMTDTSENIKNYVQSLTAGPRTWENGQGKYEKQSRERDNKDKKVLMEDWRETEAHGISCKM